MIEDGLRKVLLIDFDLEAPGLSELSFCKPEYAPGKCGAREFITAILKGQQPNLSDHIAPIPGTNERLWIMPAGQDSHTEDGGQLPNFSVLADGDQLRIELLRQAEELGFHYGLVDSRTGLTEVGGLCTISLPDQLVILTGLNHQNIEGARWVLENVRQARVALGKSVGEPLIVFSHVPDSEEEKKKARITAATERLGVDIKDVEILYYHPRLSLEEELFVQEWPESRLAFTYQNLKQTLWRRNNEDHLMLLERLPRVSLRFKSKKSKMPDAEVPAEITEELSLIEQTVRRLYPTDTKLLLALAHEYLSFDDAKLNREGATILGEAFKCLRLLDSELHSKCLQLWLESGDVEGFKDACDKTLVLMKGVDPDVAASFIDNMVTLRLRKSAPMMQLPRFNFLQRGHALIAARMLHGDEQRWHWEASAIFALRCFHSGGPYTVLDEAMEACEALLKLPEATASDWILLGDVKEQVADARGAEQAFAKALALDSTNERALTDLAQTLFMMGRFSEAIDICQRGIMLPKAMPSLHKIWGRVMVMQGDINEAVRLLQSFLEHNQYDSDIVLMLARCLCAIGDVDSLNYATSIMDKYANMQDSNEFRYNITFAIINKLKGLEAKASDYLKNAELSVTKSLKSNPGNRGSLANGAELALISGNKELFIQRASALEAIDSGFSENSVILALMRWLNEPTSAPSEVIEQFKVYQNKSGYQILSWHFEEVSAYLPNMIEMGIVIDVSKSVIRFLAGLSTEDEVNEAIAKYSSAAAL